MASIIDGILTSKLPWGLVLLGVMIAVVLELAGVPALAFAVGVYLPLSTSVPIFVGGLVRWLVDRIKRTPAEESDTSPARPAVQRLHRRRRDRRHPDRGAGARSRGVEQLLDFSRAGCPPAGTTARGPSLVAFGLLTVVLCLVGVGRLLRGDGVRRAVEKASPAAKKTSEPACTPRLEPAAIDQEDAAMMSSHDSDRGPARRHAPVREASCTPTRGCGSSTTCRCKQLKEKYGFEPTAGLARAPAVVGRPVQQRRVGLVRLGRRPGDDQPPRRRRHAPEDQHAGEGLLQGRLPRQDARRGAQVPRPGAERPGRHRGRDRRVNAAVKPGMDRRRGGRQARRAAMADDREGIAREDRPAERRRHPLPGRPVPPLHATRSTPTSASSSPPSSTSPSSAATPTTSSIPATTSTSASSAPTRTASPPGPSTTSSGAADGLARTATSSSSPGTPAGPAG